MMFNVYILRQDVEIGNKNNYFESPLITKDTFHSQFKLDMDQYRDNNNFMIHNEVTTDDSRWPFASP